MGKILTNTLNLGTEGEWSIETQVTGTHYIRGT